jgi:hypothetical protein
MFLTYSSKGTFTITSFLPIQFWQKRGLILLLNNPAVTFTQLPDMCVEEQDIALSSQELLTLLNPIAICEALEIENLNWLQFFIKYYFDKNMALGVNPLNDAEFLGKLIKNKLSVLNHSSSNDLQARYILPVNTLLSNLIKFPNRLEKVKVVFNKTQVEFFDSYVVFELLCYFEHYDSISKDRSLLSIKHKALYKTLIILKEFDLNSFDRDQITFNLETLSQLKNQYLALKDE